MPIFIATGLIWLALLVFYSTTVYGDLLPPYFLSSHVSSGRFSIGNVKRQYVEAALGGLFSPGKGLFIYLPFLLPVAVLLWRFRKSLPDKRLIVCSLAVCVAHWQLISLFRNWWGGAGFGPRLFSDILPWLFLLTLMTLPAWRSSLEVASSRSRRLWIAPIALLVAASIFIHTRGATAKTTLSWGQRPFSANHSDKIELFRNRTIWDWRYPQFMAGLITPPYDQHPLVLDIQKQIDDSDPDEVSDTRQVIAKWITSSKSVPGRNKLGEGVGSVGLSRNSWTPANNSVLLVLFDPDNHPDRQIVTIPRLQIRVASKDSTLPIDVHIDDGLSSTRLQFWGSGEERLNLDPLNDGEYRLVMIRPLVVGTDPSVVQRSVFVYVKAALYTPPISSTKILVELENLQREWNIAAARDLATSTSSFKVPSTTCTNSSFTKIFNVYKDCWTLGTAPMAFLAVNRTDRELSPYAEVVDPVATEDDPTHVFTREGEGIQTHLLADKEPFRLQFGPLAPRETRLYVLWTDRSRVSSGKNSRTLGIRVKSIELEDPEASPIPSEDTRDEASEGVGSVGREN